MIFDELAMLVIAALLLGSYLARHHAEPRFALPALGLHLAAIALIIASVWQLAALRAWDASASVIEAQQRLAQVQLVRARANRWTLLASPLLWTLGAVVVPHAIGGVDTARVFGAAWLAANAAVGVAVLAIAIWITGHPAVMPRAAALLDRLGADWSGDRLAAARRELGQFREASDAP